MGTIQHHAMIVTSYDKDDILAAHKAASDLSPHVTPIIPASCNGYSSFAVLPDGSKEFWMDSNAGDTAREAIKKWIDAQSFKDGSNSIAWAEVSFGELEPTIETNQ